MASQLSGIAVILFIAFGSLTFILLFIFAKRQITRFALKTRYRPHYPSGSGSSKSLIKEIERRLDVIDYIRCEPRQLNETLKLQFQDEILISQISPPHAYRMKVVDDVKDLCKFLKAENITRSRHILEDVMQYFEFTFDHYCQFAELLQVIKDDVTQSPRKPENPVKISKVMPSEDLEQVDESSEPLLIKSYSPISNCSSNRKITHETAV